MKEWLVLVLPAAFLAACATTTATPGGQRVRVTSDSNVVQGCQFKGNVQAGSLRDAGSGQAETQVRLQNKTAELGGNVVRLSSAGGDGSNFWASGEAYQCN
jgi:hypothetical protein